MSWQNPFKKAPSTESTRLTDPETLSMLERKARAIADEAAPDYHITDEEIHQMALVLAEHAASNGEPLDEEIISDPHFESRIIDALEARKKVRGEPKTYVVPQDGGVVGHASSVADVQKAAKDQREAS